MDLFIVLFYLISTLILGVYHGRNIKTLKDFSTSYNYSTPVLLATLFATVIGGGSTLGIVTNVHKYGIIFMFAFMGAALNKYLVAYFIAPKIQKLKNVDSLGDVFENNYGLPGRLIAGFCIIFVCIACIGNHITAIGFVFENFFNVPFEIGILLAFGSLVVYSSFGGIRAVIATDVYQFSLIAVFVPMVLITSLNKIGGINNFISLVPMDKISFSSQLSYVPHAITVFGMMLTSGFDPAFVQRIFMAKEVDQGKRITNITGHFSLALFLAMGIIGLIASILFPDIDSNTALPYLIKNTLPPVLLGIAISGLVATIMSSADSLLHVAGVSIIEDLILPFKKNISEKNKLIYVRSLTVVMGLLSLLIAFLIKDIFSIIIFAFSFWAPTILVPFIMILYGYIFSKRDLLQGVFIGISTVILWSFFLKEVTGLSGFIPGTISNLLFFTYCCWKRKTNE